MVSVKSGFVLLIFVVGCQLILYKSYQSFSDCGSVTNIKNVKVVTSENTKWILGRDVLVGEWLKTKQGKQEVDFLLHLRKLVLFSVYEVNLRLQTESCSQWWATPLTVQTMEQRNVSYGVTQYTLTYEAQPGRIPFESVIIGRQYSRNSTHPYSSEDLSFISGRRLDSPSSNCASLNLKSMCLCPEEQPGAEEKTREIQEKWKVDDPEMISWPMNVSMTVPHYINYEDKKLYHTSPSNKTKFCGSKIKMVLMITSAAFHINERKLIRETFGNPELIEAQGVRLVFAFGRIKDTEIQDKIDAESLVHDDLIQANYDHSYHNLTLRQLTMFNWLVKRCEAEGRLMPKWILKSDDDFIINMPLALRVAEANPEAEMIGCLYCGTDVIRDVAYMRKYYMPKYMYPPQRYNGYLTGALYFVQTKILNPLLKASLTTPIFQVDDAFITGYLAKEIGVRPHPSYIIGYGRIEPGPCQSKLELNSYALNASDFLNQWNNFILPIPDTCSFDESRLKVQVLNKQQNIDCLFE